MLFYAILRLLQILLQQLLDIVGIAFLLIELRQRIINREIDLQLLAASLAPADMLNKFFRLAVI